MGDFSAQIDALRRVELSGPFGDEAYRELVRTVPAPRSASDRRPRAASDVFAKESHHPIDRGTGGGQEFHLHVAVRHALVHEQLVFDARGREPLGQRAGLEHERIGATDDQVGRRQAVRGVHMVDLRVGELCPDGEAPRYESIIRRLSFSPASAGIPAAIAS